MKEWQFNILFFVGVGGAVLMLIGPEIGLDIKTNGTTVTGVGAILAYILTQKANITKNGKGKDEAKKEEGDKKPQHKKEDDDGPAQ